LLEEGEAEELLELLSEGESELDGETEGELELEVLGL